MEIFALYSQIDTGTSSKSRFVKSGVHDHKKKRCINGIYPPSRDPGSEKLAAGRLSRGLRGAQTPDIVPL